MDKRDLAELFRDRLTLLLQRRGGNLSHFAANAGVDRSALSQFLTAGSTRLPRAETLRAIAERESVSLDWLLGLTMTEAPATEMAPALEIERAHGNVDDALLGTWHKEALGYKIRYVPVNIPDLLRLDAVTRFEFRQEAAELAETKSTLSRSQLEYTRRPETDMEVCMPMQTLDHLRNGEGIWAGLDAALRKAQLAHMAKLIHELYPTFRLFLFDAHKAYSAPYTVFGPIRAAIYVGQMYAVINAVDHIRALSNHFDDLIRIADVGPERLREHFQRYLD